jgi:hypothetical protein
MTPRQDEDVDEVDSEDGELLLIDFDDTGVESIDEYMRLR